MLSVYVATRDPDGRATITKAAADVSKVGRWCKPPEEPDRCYECRDPETGARYPAEGYITDEAGWRYGTCHRCQRKATLHKLVGEGS